MKLGWGDPARRKRSQKESKEIGTTPYSTPMVRSPTKDQLIQPQHICRGPRSNQWRPIIISLVSVCSISVSPHMPRLPRLVQNFLNSALCFAVVFCICFHQLLVEASPMTVMLSSCLQEWQNSIKSVRVGSLSWPGFQDRKVIGWPSHRFPHHLYSYISCRQNKM